MYMLVFTRAHTHIHTYIYICIHAYIYRDNPMHANMRQWTNNYVDILFLHTSYRGCLIMYLQPYLEERTSIRQLI